MRGQWLSSPLLTNLKSSQDEPLSLLEQQQGFSICLSDFQAQLFYGEESVLLKLNSCFAQQKYRGSASADALVLFPERRWTFKIFPPSSPGLQANKKKSGSTFIRQNTVIFYPIKNNISMPPEITFPVLILDEAGVI